MSIKRITLLTATLALAGFVALNFTTPALAVDVLNCGQAPASSTVCGGGNDTLFGEGSIWANVLRLFTFLIGAAAVIMLLIGGFKYVTSNGDQASITSAKNTILYAVIGIIVALMAGGIVTFVVQQF